MSMKNPERTQSDFDIVRDGLNMSNWEPAFAALARIKVAYAEWKKLWERAANSVLGLQAENERLRRIEEAARAWMAEPNRNRELALRVALEVE